MSPPLSIDDTLASLIVSTGSLDQTFSSSVITYTETVPNMTTTMTVTPTANDPTATITVNGGAVASGAPSRTVNLSVGSNTITVVVTAQNGAIKTYTITVTRLAISSDATLSSLTASIGALTSSGGNTYTASVIYTVTSLTVTPTANNQYYSSITVNGTGVTSGSASGNINLTVGNNTITVVVTAQDGTTTSTYTITVTRAAISSDATLSSLTISNGTFTFNGGTSYTTSVGNSVSSVTIIPTANNQYYSSITVNGTPVTSGTSSNPINLTVGSNTITVVVTAQNGTTTDTYTITVTRVSTVSTLSNLTISGGGSLTFSSGISFYTTTVGTGVTSITLFPTHSQANATITVNGTTVASGSPAVIPINIGDNTVSIVVTAQDGVTTSNYEVVIYRPAATNSGSTNLITTNSYQTFYNALNYITVQSYDYPLQTQPVVAGSLIKANQWDFVYNDVDRINVHQYGAGSILSVPQAGYGNEILNTTTNDITNILSSLITSYLNVHPDQLSASTTTKTVSVSTSSITPLYTVTNYTMEYTWSNPNQALAFFNLGGSFTAPGFASSDFVYTPLDYFENNILTTSTHANGCTQTVTAFTVANGIEINVRVEANATTSTTGSITYYYSNDLTGGIPATRPLAQEVALEGIKVLPFIAPVLTGNTYYYSTMTIKNNSPNDIAFVTAQPPSFTPDARGGIVGLYDSVSSNVIPAFGTSTLTMLYFNPSTIDTNGIVLDNSLTIYTDPGSNTFNSVLTIPVPITANFGITAFDKVHNPAFAGVERLNSYYEYTFQTAGYGGALNHLTDVSVTNIPGLSILPGYSVEGSTLAINPGKMINGTVNATISVSAVDNSNVSASTVIPVQYDIESYDYNLGTWLSAQSPSDCVMGLSYDVINGQNCLTIGFGMGGGGSAQLATTNTSTSVANGYDEYSNYAIGQLGRKFNSAQNLIYTGIVSGYSDFLKTYGVWNSGSTGNVNKTYSFIVRDIDQYNWQMDYDAGEVSITVNGFLVTSQAGGGTIDVKSSSFPSGILVQGTNTITISATNNNRTGVPQNAVGFRIYAGQNTGKPNYGYDIWSTQDAGIPTWAEIGRITLTGQAQTYQVPPNIYNSKSAFSNSFSSYFANGSIITVSDNGYGQLSITLNGLSGNSGDPFIDTTLLNSQYIFYYYSAITTTLMGRYNNIGGDGSTTPFFTGFAPPAVDPSINSLIKSQVTTITLSTPSNPQPGTDWLYKLIVQTIESVIIQYLISYAISQGLVGYTATMNGLTADLATYYSNVAGTGAQFITQQASEAQLAAYQEAIDNGFTEIAASDAGNAAAAEVVVNYEGTSMFQVGLSFIQTNSTAATGYASEALTYITSSVVQFLAPIASYVVDGITNLGIISTVPISDVASGSYVATTEIVAISASGGIVTAGAAGEALSLAEAGQTLAESDYTVGVFTYLIELLPAATCFTEDTLIDMYDGTQKRIVDIVEGDLIFNFNKTKINKVTFFEYDVDDTTYELFSPSANFEPFATTNHPLIIDNEFYAVYPEENYKNYPWLGLNKKLEPNSIVSNSKKKVYSLWVDGDNTFRVNGYGTHSIFGDGAGLLFCYNQNLLTKDQVLQIRKKFVSYGNDAVYGGMLYNKFLAWTNSKLLAKTSSAILKDNENYMLLEKSSMAMFKIVGKIARLLTSKRNKI